MSAPDLAAPGSSPAGVLRTVTLALLAYTLCTCAFFWPVVRDATAAFPQDLGDPPSQAWIIGWSTHILLTHPTQLWDANIFYPTLGVFAYQDSLLGYAPVAMPLLLISGNLPLTYNVLFLLSFTLCGAFAFLFIRYLLEVTGCAARSLTPAALLGGLIYAFLPFKMSHLGHLNLLSAQWLPLIFLCWERGWRRGGRLPWVGLGLCVVLQALCALYYAIFGGLALLFLLALRLRREGARAAPWRPLALTGAGTGLALLPVLLPYIQTVRTLGGTRPLGQTVAFSPGLRDLLHASPQSILYGWTDRLFPPHALSSPQYLFVGLVPLALAGVGARALRRLRHVLGEPGAVAGQPLILPRFPQHVVTLRPYVALGISAGVLALGPFLRIGAERPVLPLPYLILYALAPGFQGLRDPGRFMIVAGLCLAVVAAWGAATVVSRLPQALSRGRALPLVWAALGAVVLLEYALSPVAMPRVAVGAAIPPVYRWLAHQPPATAVLELPIGLDTRQVWSQQCLMMYYSTYHWRPIVNGTGGFSPPGYERLLPVLRSFPSARSLTLLRGWRVRYVIVHGAWVGRATAERIDRGATARRLRLVGRWGNDSVYVL